MKTARARKASRGPWSRAMPVSCSPRTYQFVIGLFGRPVLLVLGGLFEVQNRLKWTCLIEEDKESLHQLTWLIFRRCQVAITSYFTNHSCPWLIALVWIYELIFGFIGSKFRLNLVCLRIIMHHVKVILGVSWIAWCHLAVFWFF